MPPNSAQTEPAWLLDMLGGSPSHRRHYRPAARFAAEFLGTLILVLFGCGATVLGGDQVGQLGVALSFGFAIVAVAYAIGPISGGHVNPAVSLAFLIAGRMSLPEATAYWAAQFSGAVAGAAILLLISGYGGELGQNGWGSTYAGAYPLVAAASFEVAMTAVFVVVVLGSTAEDAPMGFAGLAIGLTLAAIHIVGIQVDGVSVNPARSFGPALLVGGKALGQLWLFFVAPAAGAVLGALAHRFMLDRPDGLA